MPFLLVLMNRWTKTAGESPAQIILKNFLGFLKFAEKFTKSAIIFQISKEKREIMKEFFGIGGYTRTPEGAFSWQHLTFVTSLMIIMVVLAVFLGKRNKNKSDKQKNLVLIWAAILIDGFELVKIILACVEDLDAWRRMLPLFLCSIQLIAIPLAAFTTGRIRESALDFVSVFGLLGAVLGTFGATQNYNAYPVMSFTNVVSGITHTISGFAALYIMISGIGRMNKQNMWITFAILMFFCVAAYTANVLVDYNYMFLMAGDGTPYDILYNLVGGHKVFYPLGVVLLFVLYICIYYSVYFMAHRKSRQKAIA